MNFILIEQLYTSENTMIIGKLDDSHCLVIGVIINYKEFDDVPFNY